MTRNAGHHTKTRTRTPVGWQEHVPADFVERLPWHNDSYIDGGPSSPPDIEKLELVGFALFVSLVDDRRSCYRKKTPGFPGASSFSVGVGCLCTSFPGSA